MPTNRYGLTEYNEERVMQGMYEDGMDVGLARGRAEGRADMKRAIYNLVQNTGKSFDEACAVRCLVFLRKIEIIYIKIIISNKSSPAEGVLHHLENFYCSV